MPDRLFFFDEAGFAEGRERSIDLGVLWLGPDGFEGPGITGPGVTHPFADRADDAAAGDEVVVHVVDHFAHVERLAKLEREEWDRPQAAIAVDLGAGGMGVEVGPELDRLWSVVGGDERIECDSLFCEWPVTGDPAEDRAAAARCAEARRRTNQLAIRLLLHAIPEGPAAVPSRVREAVESLIPVSVTDGGDWVSLFAPRPVLTCGAVVISRPRRDRAVVDVGRAVVPGLESFRVVSPDGSESVWVKAGEYHSPVPTGGAFRDLAIGDAVTIAPDRPWIVLGHADPASVVIRGAE